MPTYEYVCGACGHEFEVFHSITADPIRKCPACGKLKVTRKISIGAAVLFKGGGFYETDYRSESYTKAAEADRKAAEPASESKPAADAATSTSGKDAKEAGAAKGPAEKPAAPASPAKEQAPKDPPSKATHPSRVGRGAGNVVQNPPQPPSKPLSKPPSTSKAKSPPRKKP